MGNLNSRLRRSTTSMRAHDALPAPLRRWLKQAALPWSERSARKVWERALRDTRGDAAAALARLDRAEARLLARDSAQVWGAGYPAP
jgi:hypothetical protein